MADRKVKPLLVAVGAGAVVLTVLLGIWTIGFRPTPSTGIATTASDERSATSERPTTSEQSTTTRPAPPSSDDDRLDFIAFWQTSERGRILEVLESDPGIDTLFLLDFDVSADLVVIAYRSSIPETDHQAHQDDAWALTRGFSGLWQRPIVAGSNPYRTDRWSPGFRIAQGLAVYTCSPDFMKRLADGEVHMGEWLAECADPANDPGTTVPAPPSPPQPSAPVPVPPPPPTAPPTTAPPTTAPPTTAPPPPTTAAPTTIPPTTAPRCVVDSRRIAQLEHEYDVFTQNYQRSRALAVYEGRIDDARMLDLHHSANTREYQAALAALRRCEPAYWSFYLPFSR